MFARDAIYAAEEAEEPIYTGLSSPWWYGVKDLQMLFQAAPANATVGEVAADLGLGYQDDRQAKTLERDRVEKVLAVLRDAYQPVVPEKLGRLGADAYDYDGYGYRLGQWVTPAGAILPYVIEVWADAKKAEKKAGCEASIVFLCESDTGSAPLYGSSAVGGIK